MKKQKALRWIFSTLKRFIPAVIAVSLLGALISFSSIALIFVSAQIINNAQAGITGKKLCLSICILAAVIVFQIAANILNGYLKTRLSGKLNIYLKEHLFSEILVKEYRDLTAFHSGELVNRFTGDIDVVVNGFAGIIPSAVSIFTKLATGIGAALVLNPVLSAAVVFILFVFPLFGRMMSKKYKQLHKDVQHTNGKIRSFVQECAQNIVVIKSFRADGTVKQKLSDILKENFSLKCKRGMLSVLTHTGLYGTFSLGYYGVLVWGAFGIATGTVKYGTLFAFLELVAQLRSPLQSVSGLLPQFWSTLASAERLMELEQLTDEAAPSAEAVDGIYSRLHALCGEGITFGYNGETVLECADFEIKKGSICALIGESGCGKSTLFKLLLGLYSPSYGSLCVKLSNGEIPLDASLRGLFAYVPQGTLVLSGTIRENITLLSGDVSDKELETAARQAEIYDFVSSLEHGFDTVIGEHGLGLSEGQLQRIAVARALLTDAPILLLDECTSALDGETERKLLENLKRENRRTVILITHRPAALDICDSVLKVSDKKIKR